MMKMLLILFLMIAWVPDAPADHHFDAKGGTKQGARNSMQKSLTQPNRLQSAPRPGISNQKAASLVMDRYSKSRILGVSLLDDQGPPVYKVRTLSPNGVVRSVFVDGSSGEVFE